MIDAAADVHRGAEERRRGRAAAAAQQFVGASGCLNRTPALQKFGPSSLSTTTDQKYCT
jgi:hypothetical protein